MSQTNHTHRNVPHVIDWFETNMRIEHFARTCISTLDRGFLVKLSCILKIYLFTLFVILSLSFLSVSDFTLLTGAVLRTSIPAMEEVISNFPGNIIN